MEAVSGLGIFVMLNAYSMCNIVFPLNKHLYWWKMIGSPSQWHIIAEKMKHGLWSPGEQIHPEVRPRTTVPVPGSHSPTTCVILLETASAWTLSNLSCDLVFSHLLLVRVWLWTFSTLFFYVLLIQTLLLAAEEVPLGEWAQLLSWADVKGYDFFGEQLGPCKQHLKCTYAWAQTFQGLGFNLPACLLKKSKACVKIFYWNSLCKNKSLETT